MSTENKQDRSTESRRALRKRRHSERVRIDGRWVHPDAPHGTPHGRVSYGCRCEECRGVGTRDQAARRTRRMSERVEADGHLIHPGAPHGTMSGSAHWGCGCEPCREAARRSKSGTPTRAASRYRVGARDLRARAGHAKESREWRHDLARIAFDGDDQAALFRGLRSGQRLSQAAALIGMTPNGIHGRARWDAKFRDALEAVLTETCPAGDRCGTKSGKRNHGGHCRACRIAHYGKGSA